VGSKPLDAQIDVDIFALCLTAKAKSHCLSQLTTWMPDAEKARSHIRIASAAFGALPPFNLREKMTALIGAIASCKTNAIDKKGIKAFLELKTSQFHNNWSTTLDPTSKQMFVEMLPQMTGNEISSFIDVVKTLAAKDRGDILICVMDERYVYTYIYIYIYIIYNKGVLVVLDSVTVDFPKQSGIRNCIWCMVCYSNGPSVRPGAA
jgi:hypothetical protein